MALLGIDLGTSSVKVIVLGEDGQTRGAGRANYPLLTPQPGWAEGLPQQWWQATVTATHAALAEAAPADITAIGLAGQMHGVVMVGGDGTPLRPAIIWADARATAEVGRYASLPAPLRASLANPLVPGMMGPLLLWLRDHEPAVYAATRWALSPKDWLRMRLTGIAASEPSDASATLLYDIPRDRWADAVITALGLRRALFPDLRPSATVAGSLGQHAALDLGLPMGIPVAMGGADTACAALGGGLLTPGTTQVTLGTGAQIIQLTQQPQAEALPRTHLYRTVADSGWYHMAAVQNGGLALEWVRRTLGATWEELYASATGIDPGAAGVMFVPYLTPERGNTPSTMGGTWAGLRLDHTQAHLLHAALEGVAFSIRAALATLPGKGDAPLRLAGGGSVNARWRQMLADILARPLAEVDVADASARGAALLAGMATGQWPREADMAPSVTSMTLPEPSRVADYADLYQRRQP
ncbi:MAG: xylulose kinase [Ktedonobacterales bacterium]|nr:xylulose kinase [Ktedonobacterales bacterium]